MQLMISHNDGGVRAWFIAGSIKATPLLSSYGVVAIPCVDAPKELKLASKG